MTRVETTAQPIPIADLPITLDQAKDHLRQEQNDPTQTSGVLVIGTEYKILLFVAGDDFANVGGSNVTGSVFTATGDTPAVWTNSSQLAKGIFIEDDILTGFIAAAAQLAEQYTQKRVVTRSFTLTFDRGEVCPAIEDFLILEQHVNGGLAIDSFETISDETPPIALAVPALEFTLIGPRLVFEADFPSASVRKYGAYDIKYTVTRHPITAAFTDGMLKIINHLYENREAASIDTVNPKMIPLSILSTFASEKVFAA